MRAAEQRRFMCTSQGEEEVGGVSVLTWIVPDRRESSSKKLRGLCEGCGKSSGGRPKAVAKAASFGKLQPKLAALATSSRKTCHTLCEQGIACILLA